MTRCGEAFMCLATSFLKSLQQSVGLCRRTKDAGRVAAFRSCYNDSRPDRSIRVVGRFDGSIDYVVVFIHTAHLIE